MAHATDSPAAVPVVEALVEDLRRRTGVVLRLFDARGGALPSAAETDAVPAPPTEAALEALAGRALQSGADEVAEAAGGVGAAWPIRVRGRTVVVAAGYVPLAEGADPALGRALLAAVAEALRARQAQAEAEAQCDSLSGALAQSFEELSLLHNIGEILRVTRPIPSLLEHLCAELCATTGAEGAVAYLPELTEGPVLYWSGVVPVLRDRLPALFDHVHRAAVDHVLVHNHCQDDPDLAPFGRDLERLAVVPLLVGKESPGALALFNRPGEEFGSPEAKLLRSSANACAVFIENRRLYRELHRMMLDLVRALASSVDAKDPYTCGHSVRVALASRELATELGLNEQQVELAYMAGLLHDIGKIGTPEGILSKEGDLGPTERRVIARHPVVGGRILRGIRPLEPVRQAVLHHHERFDGAGYPDGLAGEAIPLLARIVGLADAFDAMTSDRPYRPRLPLDVVMEEIRRNRGTQFDPRLVEAFERLDKGHLTQQFAEATETVDSASPE